MIRYGIYSTVGTMMLSTVQYKVRYGISGDADMLDIRSLLITIDHNIFVAPPPIPCQRRENSAKKIQKCAESEMARKIPVFGKFCRVFDGFQENLIHIFECLQREYG